MSRCDEPGAQVAGRTPKGGVYRPRNPRASPLYQCADRHMVELRSEGRLQRLIEKRVIDRFLKCGEPSAMDIMFIALRYAAALLLRSGPFVLW